MTAAETILSKYKDIEEWQTQLYKHFHRHPELSLKEFKTAERIEEELKNMGLESQRIGETGVVTILKNGSGKTILVRADIDALPVEESTGLDYTSEEKGVMHACAHDGHIASLLGAVKLLNENKDEWSGTYIALFQPAEELAAGSQKMVDDGLIGKVPQPDLAFAQYIMMGEAGTISTVDGPILSAGDSLKITLYGRGAHGSMPQNSVDTVVLASTIVMRLQTIVSREIEPGTFAVVTVGAINSGSKSNIIPDSAELLLNLRTYSNEVREQVKRAIERIVKSECEAAGSPKEPEFEYYDQFPLTENDSEINKKVTEAFIDYFGKNRVFKGKPATASEDFSTIPKAFGVPYDYWFVHGTDSKKWEKAVINGSVAQDIPANHNPGFYPEIQPTLKTATGAQIVAALTYLGK